MKLPSDIFISNILDSVHTPQDLLRKSVLFHSLESLGGPLIYLQNIKAIVNPTFKDLKFLAV